MWTPSVSGKKMNSKVFSAFISARDARGALEMAISSLFNDGIG